MKSKKLSSLIGALSCAIFLTACSNASGGGSSDNADIFASAKTALRAMDVSVDIPAASSRSLVSKALLGQITENNGTVSADTGIGIDRWSSYTSDRLSGKTSESQCILEMCKKEVPEQITNLDFNKDYTQEVTGNYTIGSNSMTVVVKKFRVNHVKGSDEMMVFSVADVYAAADTQRNTNYGPYNSILKCKKNAFGTLDTELYMVPAGYSTKNYYKKFVRSSASEKRNITCSVESDNTHWGDMTIASSGITGYKYDKSSGGHMHYINLKGDYSAVFQVYGSSPKISSIFVLAKDGSVIMNGTFGEGSVNSYNYYLNFVSDLTGYKIKRVDSNGHEMYKLVDANNEEKASVGCIPCNTGGTRQPDSYTYYISESDMNSLGLSCSVASQIDGMAESVKDHELKDENYFTSLNIFDTTLPTALASWLSN